MMGVFEIRREAELFPEEELKNAARAVLASMVSSREETASQEHIFSPAFERRMKPLFRLDRRRNGRRDAMRWAAILLIGALLSGALFLAVDSDARAAFFGWVRTVYEKSVRYDFTSEEPNINDYKDSIELPEIDFSELSGEYEIEQLPSEKYNITYMITGKDDSGIFIFQCLRMDLNSSIVLEFNDGYSYEAVYVHGDDADYYECISGQDSNNLIWKDEKSEFVFVINSYAAKEIILEIAEKIIIQ